MLCWFGCWLFVGPRDDRYECPLCQVSELVLRGELVCCVGLVVGCLRDPVTIVMSVCFVKSVLSWCYEVSSFAVFVCLVGWLLFVGPSDDLDEWPFVSELVLRGELACLLVWLVDWLLFVICGTQ